MEAGFACIGAQVIHRNSVTECKILAFFQPHFGTDVPTYLYLVDDVMQQPLRRLRSATAFCVAYVMQQPLHSLRSAIAFTQPK